MLSSRASEELLSAVESANIPAGARILVAVSGGPDSLALLDTLHGFNLQAGTEWLLSVGHVNHGLRTQADDDEQHVRRVAESYGLTVLVRRVDVSGRAEAERCSIEDTARKLRYAALRDMKQGLEADLIALAHTRDDQVETVLLHLLRGSGLTGLAGMRTHVGDLVRPFLSVTREQILKACDERNLPYQIDESNLDRRFARNRLRLDVLPFLREEYPHLDVAMARTASVIGDDVDYLRSTTNRALSMLDMQRQDDAIHASLAAWKSLYISLQRSTLRELSSLLLGDTQDIEAGHVELMRRALMSGTDLRSQLPRHMQLHIQENRFVLSTGAASMETPSISPVTLEVPGTVTFNGGRMEARILDIEGEKLERAIAVCGPYNAFLDANSLGTTLVVRSRRPGDRMQPLGMDGSRKVQDILVDAHVDEAKRDLIPVVETHGHIAWLAGIRIDRRAAISKITTRVAQLQYIRKNGETPW